MQSENLLIEIGTEELPPKSLATLATALADNLQAELDAAGLSYSQVNWLASPRRLAVKVSQLAWQQADKTIEKRGPAVSAAFDAEGNPTKAALGWARGNGIEISQAERLSTDKGEWLVYQALQQGQPLDQLIEGMLSTAVAKLPVPKPMRWGNNKTQFIRPVHTLTVMYGERVLPASVLGKTSANVLNGHRFHSQGQVTLNHADQYEAVLEQQYVVVDFAKRKDIIRAQIDAKAKEIGAVAEIQEDLLNEVTALVEWPVAMLAEFEESFLAVPQEALIYTMKGDQKYFPLFDNQGRLINKFIFISNIESKDPIQVISGNEKVIRPRLADAQFFFNTDKKQSLESRIATLGTVVFQQKLGTLKDKSERIAELAGFIAEQLGADVQQAKRAGLLSKTDLMTNMVMEFPDVQGVMGMHYAKHDGEPENVANALNEQYMPRFAGDALPQNPISCAVALADKLDTLVGIMGIGMLPKGDKDPFALRRAAIGTLRVIAENKLPLDLQVLIAKAASLLTDKLSNQTVEQDVLEFLLGRLRALYQEQGITVDVIQAVLARKPTQPTDFAARIYAVSHFKSLAGAEALAAANKRVSNILSKNASDVSEGWQLSLLQEDAEVALGEALQAVKGRTAPAVASNDYQQVLTELATLREEVDAFFDQVMVMADDAELRKNRLGLLNDLQQQFLQVADIALLNQ